MKYVLFLYFSDDHNNGLEIVMSQQKIKLQLKTIKITNLKRSSLEIQISNFFLLFFKHEGQELNYIQDKTFRCRVENINLHTTKFC